MSCDSSSVVEHKISKPFFSLTKNTILKFKGVLVLNSTSIEFSDGSFDKIISSGRIPTIQSPS